jgi:hypothetical protein
MYKLTNLHQHPGQWAGKSVRGSVENGFIYGDYHDKLY